MNRKIRYVRCVSDLTFAHIFYVGANVSKHDALNS